MNSKTVGVIALVASLLWVLAGIVFWLWVSLSVVAPWLTGLGLVAWASSIAALVGMAFVVFWVWVIVSFIVTGVAAAVFGD